MLKDVGHLSLSALIKEPPGPQIHKITYTVSMVAYEGQWANDFF